MRKKSPARAFQSAYALRGEMHMRRTILAAGLAATIAAAAAQPAAAQESFSVSRTFTPSANHSLTQTGTGRIVGGDTSAIDIALDCEATTMLPAVGTGLLDCFLLAPDGKRYHAGTARSYPGPVAVRGALIENLPPVVYRVCVRARALWSDSSTEYTAPRTCSS
jgi:hypothetical protein